MAIRGKLTTIQCRDQVLGPHGLPLIHARNFALLEDIFVRLHAVRISPYFIDKTMSQFGLDLPPYSLDLPQMTHLWEELYMRFRKHVYVPHIVAKLTYTFCRSGITSRKGL